MAEHSFPPLGDPDRFDQIVRRGRFLRRRRHAGIGAGAGGGVAAVALAVLLVSGAGTPSTPQVVADDGPSDTTTTTTTTTTIPAPPPDRLVAEVDTTGGVITVAVTDPARPVSGAARQCVSVTLTGASGDTAEATGCDDIPAVDGIVTVELPNTGGVLIGCAAVVEREPAGPGADTELVSTTFELTPPSDLTPGDYTVEVSATSGVGDGCAGTGDEAAPGAPVSPGLGEHAVVVPPTTISLG